MKNDHYRVAGVLIMVLLSCVVASCLPAIEHLNTSAASAPFPLVEAEDYVGAIVPADYAAQTFHRYLGIDADDFWTPTPEEVSRTEQLVRASLMDAINDSSKLRRLVSEGGATEPWAAREIPKIIPRLPEYRRQYVGLIIAGRKRVFCNFFHASEADPGHGITSWRNFYVLVLDGGSWYWQVQCDLDASECVRFTSNGYA